MTGLKSLRADTGLAAPSPATGLAPVVQRRLRYSNAPPRNPAEPARPVVQKPASHRGKPGGGTARWIAAALLLLAIALTGCGDSATDSGSDPGNAPPLIGNPEADGLIKQLHETLTRLKDREPQLYDAHKEYSVERFQKLAELRSALGRSGRTLEEVRAMTGSSTDDLILQIRRADKRASELFLYIDKLNSARKRVRVLIEDHEYAIKDLDTQARMAKLLDDKLLEQAREVLAQAADQNELSPENILRNPALVVDLTEGQAATATAITASILPSRPEQSLSDLPELPALNFTISGQAEQFLLSDLQSDLDKGRKAAESHLTAGRAEAAIEELHTALRMLRERVGAYRKVKPLAWETQCLDELEAASTALSEQLAGPYLQGVADALPRARETGDWNGVLDLLEAVVRLAPSAEELPDTLTTIDTVLRYRQNTDAFDAAVALERLLLIKAILTGRPVGGIKAGDVKEITIKGIVTRWRWCPPGVFQMGSPASEAGRDDDENPVEATLTQGFWLLETEVTQGLWTAVMGTSLDWSDYGKGSEFPVYNVSQDEAVSLCEKFNGLLKSVSGAEGLAVRLPTEAEWEYAARARTTTRFFWGDGEDGIGEYAWYDGNSSGSHHPVGSKKPNAWGLCDMSGSVWEWCGDWYDDKLTGGTDPRGASSGSDRVFRGGSWVNSARYCRSARRLRYTPSLRNRDLGFRVAAVPETGPASK